MPITRVFLDFDRPALLQVVEYLVEQFARRDQLSLANALLVLPGRRVGRRLLELLVSKCEEQRLLLTPPRIETVGALPEQLYQPQLPFANEMTQDLAWARALQSTPPQKLRPVIPAPPAQGDDDRWLELGQVFRRQHVELAADGLDFRDVAERGAEVDDFQEAARWEAMAGVQDGYLALLDGVELWDKQTARLFAIENEECKTDKEIIVVGTVDMNIATRQMLDQVGDHVTAVIFAPSDWSCRFDEHGCLIPDEWEAVAIPLDMQRVRVVDGPSEQAEAVARAIAAYEGRYRADEITIGVPNERIVPDITRVLDRHDLPSRWGPGKTLAETGPHSLLVAVANHIGRNHFRDFAALVRHPDIGHWLLHQQVGGDWLTELDSYQSGHLPSRLEGRWHGKKQAASHLREAFAAVQELVAPIVEPEKPLGDWGERILNLLTTVYGDRELDQSLAKDRETLAACQAIRDAIAAHHVIPSSLAPRVTAARTIRWTLDQAGSQTIPPPAEADAIELLGWLELPLDDAPAMIVTSLNEGFVPESVNSDLFLPNRLRNRLGLLDNPRRFARDAYALSAIIACRSDVEIIVGRRNHDGDPLVPSRLLFATDRGEIAERAMAFFATPHQQSVVAPPPHSRSKSQTQALSVPRPQPLERPVEHMSVTSFRDYIACPYRFYLRHVLRLRALDDQSDELDGAAFGSLAHEVLHRFGESPDRDSADAEQIRRILHHELNQAVGKHYGREAMAVVHVQAEQLRLRLDAFADKQAEWASGGWRIEHTEVPTDDHERAELIVDGTSMPLSGRIDRIDVNTKTGQRVVFDYKTSDAARRPRDAHQKGGEWIDLQLPLYRHLVRTLDVEGPVELGYILLPKDTSRSEFCFAKWTEEELDVADDLAADIVRAVRGEKFWPPTDPAPNFFDEYAAICQDHVL